MVTSRRRGVVALLTVVALLGLSAGLATAVSDAIGIQHSTDTQMDAAPSSVPEASASVHPPAITPSAPEGLRFSTALDDLDEAISAASPTGATATLTVTVTDSNGSGPGTTSRAASGDDTYLLTGTAEALRIEAATPGGAVRGIYDLAAQVRAGRSVTEHLGETVTSRLPLRMVDLGAVGVRPDPAQWTTGTDYSHASGAFENAYLEQAPYIDASALAADYADWKTFLEHSLANGYTAVAWPGFIEYVDFADAEEGPVYAAGDSHIARAQAMRAAFAPFWSLAADLGMRVYLRTDMLALTPALQDYFTARFGSVDTTNPELWKVYTDALHRLYAEEPALSGILIRVGEGGAIYQTPGVDYYSSIDVRTAPAVQTMLRSFLAEAEASDHDVIFRSWSVGIGAVGDMHTNPASYDAVLAGIDSPKLIVSTKYTLGDFYSWLPLNDTLETGNQRRIIEFQSRREFEGFGAFPNDLGPQFQWALQTLLAKNPHIEGVWTWTQDGGPWRAGPMSLYLTSGFWQLYELNTQLAGDLARDPDADVSQITQNWARQYLSDDPTTLDAIGQAMALSRDAITQGLYIAPFAEQRVRALGLEPPPQMWLFEWDILTGDSATLSVMSSIIGDRQDEAIQSGEDAVATAERMRDLVSSTDAATWRSAELRSSFIDTMDYEVDTLRLLSAYRAMFLSQGQWHATLSADAYAHAQQERDTYETLAAAHLARYQGDVNYPAWNLTAAQLGVDRSDRDLAMAWIARGLLVLALVWLLITVVASSTRLVRRPGAAAARATWLAATRPWRAQESTLGLLRFDRWLLVLVPGALLVATRGVQTSFLAPVHLAVTLGAWALFVAVVLLLLRGRSAWAVIAAVGGVSVLRCILTLFALSFTGPGGYWYAFWTDPVLRTLYITVAFTAFVWTFVAAGWALSGRLGGRRATGTVLAGLGAGLAAPATIVGVVGLEQALTVWNDQMGLLPWGLARILGITTYLDIPDDTAWWAAAVGAALLAIGLVLALLPRRRARARSRSREAPVTP